MISTESIYTGSMSSLTLLALMIHEIDPTVKIWPGYGRDEEPTKCTILFDIKIAHTYLLFLYPMPHTDELVVFKDYF